MSADSGIRNPFPIRPVLPTAAPVAGGPPFHNLSFCEFISGVGTRPIVANLVLWHTDPLSDQEGIGEPPGSGYRVQPGGSPGLPGEMRRLGPR